MSGTVAVVPVRSLTAGKSRLAGAVEAEARAELIRLMLRNVLRALSETAGIDRVVVVSPEPAVLALAANALPEADLLAQPADHPGLLPALDLGRSWALDIGADAVAIVFGDLPRLNAADVATMVEASAELVLAPDRDRVGTNALLLRGAATESFPFRFGERSFPVHLAEAERLGLTVDVIEREGLSFDLDTPGDLAELPDEMVTVAAWTVTR